MGGVQLSVEGRFFDRIDKSGIGDNPYCWRWTGTTRKGYGCMSVQGRDAYAHRVSYEMFVEPIPAGLHIDHLCRNPACVNPVHLEPVTSVENMLRGIRGKWRRAQTHCVNGHEFSKENTVWVVSPTHPDAKNRKCRACQLVNQAKGAAKRREKRAAARARK